MNVFTLTIMEVFLILTTWLLAGQVSLASTSSCPAKEHPIYCAILKLKPTTNRTFAMKLSNYISKYSKLHGTDPMRTVAIMMQESGIRNIHRRQQVLLIQEECATPVQVAGDLVIEDNAGEMGTEGPKKLDECVEYSKVVSGYTDVGIYQFHAATIQAYGMDALRLRDDLSYATNKHCFLLAVKMRECARLGQEAWSCYHSATPKWRKKYVRMVNRYFKRIAPTKGDK